MADITAPITINQTTVSAAVQVEQPAIAASVGLAVAEQLLNLDGGTPSSLYGGIIAIDGGTP